jgi:uncharacterized membrane protein
MLRGIVIVIMALDHTRGGFCNTPVDGVPNLATTDPALFFTRWITHFCAPTFAFLAGTGAFLAGTRGKGTPQLAWFLFSRGLWLVLVELTVLHWAIGFNNDFHGNVAMVIWAIGWSMVALSGLVFLPTAAVAVIGIAIVAFHNLCDKITPAEWGDFGWLWQILHSGEKVVIAQAGKWDDREWVLYAAYPVLPWIGVLVSGYAFGALFLLKPRERRKQLMGLGLALTGLFVVLRAINGYGDTEHPWLAFDQTWQICCSFINCGKYPPSLHFVLMTLGPAIALLAFLSDSPGALGRFFVTFGRVPLFFYVLHWPLLRLVGFVLAYFRYDEDTIQQLLRDPNMRPPDWGYSLPIVYLLWIAVVLIMYFPCRWFGWYKRTRKYGWLSYL